MCVHTKRRALSPPGAWERNAGRALLRCSRIMSSGLCCLFLFNLTVKWKPKISPKDTWCTSPTMSKLALEKPVLWTAVSVEKSGSIFNVKVVKESKQCVQSTAGPALWRRGGWQSLLSLAFVVTQQAMTVRVAGSGAGGLPSFPWLDSHLHKHFASTPQVCSGVLCQSWKAQTVVQKGVPCVHDPEALTCHPCTAV